MIYLNYRNHHLLRKELRIAFNETDINLNILRAQVRDFLDSGEHRVTTVYTFLETLATETIESLTIEDLIKNNDSNIGLHNMKDALLTYLFSFAMKKGRAIKRRDVA